MNSRKFPIKITGKSTKNKKFLEEVSNYSWDAQIKKGKSWVTVSHWGEFPECKDKFAQIIFKYPDYPIRFVRHKEKAYWDSTKNPYKGESNYVFEKEW